MLQIEENRDLLLYLGHQNTSATCHMKCQERCIWYFWRIHGHLPQEIDHRKYRSYSLNAVSRAKRVIYHGEKSPVQPNPKWANFLDSTSYCNRVFVGSLGSGLYDTFTRHSLLQHDKCFNIRYQLLVLWSIQSASTFIWLKTHTSSHCTPIFYKCH